MFGSMGGGLDSDEVSIFLTYHFSHFLKEHGQTLNYTPTAVKVHNGSQTVDRETANS